MNLTISNLPHVSNTPNYQNKNSRQITNFKSLTNKTIPLEGYVYHIFGKKFGDNPKYLDQIRECCDGPDIIERISKTTNKKVYEIESKGSYILKECFYDEATGLKQKEIKYTIDEKKQKSLPEYQYDYDENGSLIKETALNVKGNETLKKDGILTTFFKTVSRIFHRH